MSLKRLNGRNYQVKVTPDKVASGRDTTLRFEIISPEGKRVTELEVVHEKLIHLLIVSKDLSWFAHEHPQLQSDGSFALNLNFPRGGEFTLYHDFTPTRVGMQVVPVNISVQGDTPADQPLTVSPIGPQSAGDGYTVEWVGSGPPFTSLQTQSLRFKVRHNGQPLNDLEPYLGALGHLIVISQDRKHFVHSHPLPEQKLPPRSVSGSPTSAASANSPAGPDVVFNALFPAPSLYKAWAQFQHKGKVLTAPFVFEVLSPTDPRNRKPMPLPTNPLSPVPRRR